MLRHLRDSIAIIGAECPVHAFGYDWRQSNADSAKALKTFVARTLKAHLATEAILVTHSMGGIVVREAVRDEWMKNATLGVVHIAQPAGGAPVTYRRCFDGASFMTDGAKMAQLMGTTGIDLFNIFTAMPSAMQLLPFDQVRTAESDWLRKRQPADGGKFVPWRKISHAIGGYKSRYHPPSLAPEINQPHLRRGDDEEARRLWAETRLEADDRLTEANQFYKTLQLRTHPNTWSLASTGVETDTHVCFDLPAEGLDGTQADRGEHRDASVLAEVASSGGEGAARDASRRSATRPATVVPGPALRRRAIASSAVRQYAPGRPRRPSASPAAAMRRGMKPLRGNTREPGCALEVLGGQRVPVLRPIAAAR